MPDGITAARPTVPRAASERSTGVSAAPSGVRPPRSGCGSSAQRSGTQMTYFMVPVLPCRSRGGDSGADERLDRGEVRGNPLDALLALEEVGEVGRQLGPHTGRGL